MAQLQEKNLRLLENAKSDMGKLIEEKSFVIMGLNNQTANLQARYENANIKSLESEQLVIQIKNNAIQRMSEIDQVKTSIWNLCTHMAQGKRQPMKIKKDNIEEQIMYIKRTLTELAKVNQILKKQARLAKLKKKVGADSKYIYIYIYIYIQGDFEVESFILTSDQKKCFFLYHFSGKIKVTKL
ncbi:unnamed protein product [Acanthoscelides obtectus]|uniref:Uncharacterized protein n=1 Tax=Acanthoscelides obtectus TaxID=200917 RepID=A0A9P0MEP6_ACAOB|nr:unnamed protein product [Acanthoscelides obtectus]CAK1676554.1 hypothetical protein AOBTE_LOCUS30816 [Acanthoscelides obtectus]